MDFVQMKFSFTPRMVQCWDGAGIGAGGYQEMGRKGLFVLVAGMLVLGSPMAVAAQVIGAGVMEDSGMETVSYETGIPGITMDETGEMFYQVFHQGTGQGRMEVSGNATGDYELVVEITKPGVVGEAVFSLSLDGGKTFIGQDVVAEHCRIGGAGIVLHFSVEQDNMEFSAGEVYSASLPETFPVAASRVRDANVVVAGHPMGDHELVITVLSSGGLGEAKFFVSQGEQRMSADVIPEDGVYELEDGLRLVFSDAVYEKGLVYHVTVKSNDTTVNYMPLYILSGIVVVAGVSVLLVLTGRREKPGDYKLHSYEGKKEKYD